MNTDDPGFFQVFRNATKMKDLLAQAGDFREKFEQIKMDLAQKTVEGEAGAGAVRVVMNGKMEVVKVSLDRPLLMSLATDGAETDQRMVEDLITAAFNSAVIKARDLIGQELRRATGGFDIPGLQDLISGS